jgi:hypothetical protein
VDRECHGRKLLGRLRPRWKDFITGSCLLLAIRRWRGLSGDKDIGGEIVKRPGPVADIGPPKNYKF